MTSVRGLCQIDGWLERMLRAEAQDVVAPRVYDGDILGLFDEVCNGLKVFDWEYILYSVDRLKTSNMDMVSKLPSLATIPSYCIRHNSRIIGYVWICDDKVYVAPKYSINIPGKYGKIIGWKITQYEKTKFLHPQNRIFVKHTLLYLLPFRYYRCSPYRDQDLKARGTEFQCVNCYN